MKNCKKVYLGSLNPAKLNAVKEVLEDFEVIGVKVDSNVSNQPKSDEETINGALNRARSLPNDGLRIGLEAGVEFHNNKLFLINWGVLIDLSGNEYIAGGTRIELPDYVRKGIFEENKELADIMGEVFKDDSIRLHQGAIGIFTHGQIERKDIFTHVVKLLYGEYLYKQEGENQ